MFKIIKKDKKSKLRIGKLATMHGVINTPVFMPVGTVGAVKGISPEELRNEDAEIILGNTYHLYLRPGEKLIKKMGGLQKFNNWNGPILTDSGGFQVFSLGMRKNKFQITNNKFQINLKEQKDNSQNDFSLVKISEKGVWFKSHIDGSKHFFTPEKVIDIQLALGSDIIMVLDICTEFPATYERAKEAMELTHRWAKRSIIHFQKKIKDQRSKIKMTMQNAKFNSNHEARVTDYINRPLLFGIAQGSTYKDLRIESTEYISSLGFDGIAVGGVSVGEGKKHMYEVVRWVSPYLPEDKPHYLMGVGEPEDLVYATRYGFDMFDCVLPTRLGRHGVIWTQSKLNPKYEIRNPKFEKIDIRKRKYKLDKKPLVKNCKCYTCTQGFSRSYLHHLIKEKEMFGMRLLSIHNISFLIQLMKEIRKIK